MFEIKDLNNNTIYFNVQPKEEHVDFFMKPDKICVNPNTKERYYIRNVENVMVAFIIDVNYHYVRYEVMRFEEGPRFDLYQVYPKRFS